MKLRNLRKLQKSQNFAEIDIRIHMRSKEAPRRNCEFYEICENRENQKYSILIL